MTQTLKSITVLLALSACTSTLGHLPPYPPFTGPVVEHEWPRAIRPLGMYALARRNFLMEGFTGRSQCDIYIAAEVSPAFQRRLRDVETRNCTGLASPKFVDVNR